jgi:hypothetical protein
MTTRSPQTFEESFLRRIDPRAHQLVRRFAGLESWPSLPLTALTGLAALLISGLASASLLRADLLSGFVLGVAVLIAFGLAAVAAGTAAARLVRRDLHFHPLDSMGLEGVPRHVLAQAYSASLLWRFRMGLASAAALIPALAAGVIAVSAIGLAVSGSEEVYQPVPADISGPLGFALIAGLGLWGLSVLAVALGVLEGLRRQPAEAALLRTALPLLALFIFIAALFGQVGPLLREAFSALPIGQTVLLFAAALLIAMPPYALTIWLLRAPRR